MQAEYVLASLLMKEHSCLSHRAACDEHILVYLLSFSQNDTNENKLCLPTVEFDQFTFNVVTVSVFAAIVH